jgi:asparagine synthase (glutamine-hydrolysing)
MCGIYGELTRKADAAARALFDESARRVLHHRGPDGHGRFADDHCLLGQTRLKIVDLTLAASQPMTSGSGRCVLVHNGEIFNYPEIRAEMDAPPGGWRSTGDTEVLLELLERRGLDGLPRTVGMFACGLWRADERELLLVRDYLGQKPLFWTMLPNGDLRFASEVGALLEDGVVPRRFSADRVAEFLQYGYNHAPRSSFENIHSVPPGHALRARLVDDRIEVRLLRYWSLPDHDARPAEAHASWLEQFDALLQDAVRIRMRADVPVGSFLSGGVDSSLVTLLANRVKGGALPTLNVDFRERAFSEAPFAREVAEHLGTDHRHVLLGSPNEDVFDDIVAITGELHGNFSILAQLAASRAMRRRVTVCLTGNGGDELLGGYTRYAVALAAAGTPTLVSRSSRLLAAHFPSWLRGESRLGVYSGDLTLSYVAMMRQYPGRTVPPLFGSNSPTFVDPVVDAMQRHAARPSIFRMLATDLDTYLPGDIHTCLDRSSMACSLELRSPFLDHRLHVHVTHARPEWILGPNGRGKEPLRTLYSSMLPASVFGRPKQGFGIPAVSWLRGEKLRKVAGRLLEPRSPLFYDVLDSRAVRRILDAFRLHIHPYGSRIWLLLLLEAWMARWRPSLV